MISRAIACFFEGAIALFRVFPQGSNIVSGSRDVTCNVSTSMVNDVFGAGFTNNEVEP